MTGTHTAESSSIDAAEVDRFAAKAEDWWDAAGPYRPLHQLNPVRLAYIRDHLCDSFGRDPKSLDTRQFRLQALAKSLGLDTVPVRWRLAGWTVRCAYVC